MNENDRAVQVPVSLTERIERELEYRVRTVASRVRMAEKHDEPYPREWVDNEVGAGRERVRALLSQPTPTAEPGVPATELPQLRYSADLHAGRLRARVRELPDSYRRDAALMTEAADQLEYLSRAELDNHHAADMCPYCTPDPTQRRRDQVDVDALVHELFPERQPTAEPPRIEDTVTEGHTYVDGRFGDDGVCHARIDGRTVDGAWPGRCYRSRADRVHVDSSTIRDVPPPKGDDRG